MNEVQNWQGFLQQTIRLCALGYTRHKLTVYPNTKRGKWGEIDQKLISNYPLLALSKFQRARRKVSGLLNAQFLRWDRYSLLLATAEGTDDCKITELERFASVFSQSIIFDVSPTIRLMVGRRNNKFTAFIETQTFKNLEAYYVEQAKRGDEAIIAEFAGLNAFLPSWSGIIRQKIALRAAIVKSARSAGHKWHTTQFPVSNKKRTFKVFSASDPEGA